MAAGLLSPWLVSWTARSMLPLVALASCLMSSRVVRSFRLPLFWAQFDTVPFMAPAVVEILISRSESEMSSKTDDGLLRNWEEEDGLDEECL